MSYDKYLKELEEIVSKETGNILRLNKKDYERARFLIALLNKEFDREVSDIAKDMKYIEKKTSWFKKFWR